MRTAPLATRRGITTLELLVAFLILGVSLQAVLAIHLATFRATSRATSHRRLASRAASVADSLGTLGCGSASGAWSTPDGRISWTTRHHPQVASADLIIAPVAGPAWRLEMAAPC
jgi:Tfp pilus assembly protein PilV